MTSALPFPAIQKTRRKSVTDASCLPKLSESALPNVDYRREAEALFNAGRKDEGMELVHFCVSRLYMFPDVSDRIYFLSNAGMLALHRQDPRFLRYVLSNLLRLFNRGASGPLLRLMANGGGVDAIVRQAKLSGFPRLELQLLGAHRLLSGSLWGKTAVKGFQFCLSALRQVRSAGGESQTHLLLSKGGSGGAQTGQREGPILVTRGMGGIGDILMMTPGLAALKGLHPEKDVHFAVPRSLQCVLQGFPGVTVLDIDGNVFHQEDYGSWFNLTECPATRIESLTLPYVRANRIDVYAGAMGLDSETIAAGKKLPWYQVTGQERAAASQFMADRSPGGRAVVGVHLFATDDYKDYGKNPELVRMLAQKYFVLLFHDRPIEGYDFANVAKVERAALRDAFALLEKCAICIGPDSSFLHAAAALSIPFVALFGPTSGKVFARYYPKVTVVCSEGCCEKEPCWRNQSEACLRTGCSKSECLQRIEPEDILRTAEDVLLNSH